MNLLKKFKSPLALALALMLITATLWSPIGAKAESNNDILNINAKSAILLDAKTGKILYEKNIDQMYPPASMTKMMTEYLVQKAVHDGKIKWSTVVPISQKASDISHNTNFSGVPLRTDYKYTVQSLYEALAIFSSNAAAVALAELLGGGNEANFVKQMNQTAKKLGMTETKYINSSGLDNVDLGKYIATGGPNDTNLISARDLAKIAFHIVNEYPEALKVSSIPEKDFVAGPGEVVHMTNYNYMLPGFGVNMREFKYPGVDGLKTGFTDAAGECFTGTVKQGDRRFISVVMGTASEQARFLETKKLYDYGFQQTENKKIVGAGYKFKDKKSIAVSKGKAKEVDIDVKETINIPVESGQAKNYKPVLHLDKSLLNKDGKLKAPIKKGQTVGYVTVDYIGKGQKPDYLYGQIKVPVVTTESVDKANWFVLTFRAIGGFIGGIFSGAIDMVKGWF
ncbi:MAG: D-alanyl-D-alanine carboxypeptidase family protein [Tuberibacillus sp.]